MTNLHKTVLLEEAISFLNVKPEGRYIDVTVGGGGHSEAILQRGGVVLALDQDPTALDIARKRLKANFRELELKEACPGTHQLMHPLMSVFRLVHANFANLSIVASEECFSSVDGILFDLGFSSIQLEDPNYGLAFSKEGPLDMRLDPRLGVTAADLVNTLPEKQLVHLFQTAGEVRSRQIARAIVAQRVTEPFKTTTQLRELIEKVSRAEGKIHPATRVFMALRIAVNSEFENLNQGLTQAFSLLKTGGRLVVISFHSGEDRIVKNFFREQTGMGKIITKKPIEPTIQEINLNPRARSAKLRILEKI